MGAYGRILCAVALAAAIPAVAAEPISCTERSKFVHYLADTYTEKPIAISVTDSGNVIEFLMSRTGNTWTIISTTPDGVACRLAAGDGWQILQHNVTQ